MDLINTLQRPESKTLEFKRDLSSPDGVLRTLVAFANTAGGTLLIGVEDTSRLVRGVENPLDLEERLTNLISDSIAPRLIPELEIVPWRRTYLVAVQVYPSSSRPHFLEREGPEAGVYVRVGSTNRHADADMVAELRRFSRGEAFDEQAVPDLDPEALDFRAASESFALVRRLKRTDFETLRLVTKHQGRLVPTTGGMLLFGHNRLQLYADAWIQAGRFAGTNKARIVDQNEIRSYPVEAVGSAMAFIEKHSLRGAEFGAVRREDRWNLPPVAVREAIVNAVVHADYSQRGAPIRVSVFADRLEIENPGLLPFGLTVDDLRRGVSRLRNRVIGRVFHELRMIEHWGSGIQRMTEACTEAGLAAPFLEEIGSRFRVTLYTARVGPVELDAVDRSILEHLDSDVGRSTREISLAISLTPRATRNRLRKLVERGTVIEIGSSPQDPRKRYFRAHSA